MKLTGKVALVTNVTRLIERMVKNVLAGRLARSEESARLAAYLAWDDADLSGAVRARMGHP